MMRRSSVAPKSDAFLSFQVEELEGWSDRESAAGATAAEPLIKANMCG